MQLIHYHMHRSAVCLKLCEMIVTTSVKAENILDHTLNINKLTK